MRNTNRLTHLHQFIEHPLTQQSLVWLPVPFKQTILSIVTNLPAFSGVIYECHLNSTPLQVDFSIRIERQEILYYGADLLQIFDTLFSTADEEWMSLRHFLKAWSQERRQQKLGLIQTVWLEFDITEDQITSLNCPSIFFSLEQSGSPDSILSNLTEALTLLAYPKIPNAIDTIKTLTYYTFPHPQIHYIGLMLSRNTRDIRICLDTIPINEVITYLKAIEWSGHLAEVTNVVTTYAHLVEQYTLHLQFEEDILPLIGIELYVTQTDNWELLLNELIHQGDCKASIVKEIINFPATYPLTEWVATQQHDALTATNQTLTGSNRINHCKININENGERNAKIYLYSCFYYSC